MVKKIKHFLHNKLVLIVGLGKTGISAYNFLIDRSVYPIITDSDISKKKQFPEFNFQSLQDIDFSQINYIFLSPGVAINDKNNILLKVNIKKYNIPLLGDIELNYLYNNKSTYIGITGTNGKSTTTSLIHHILEYHRIYNNKTFSNNLCGNIGIPILSIPLKQKEDKYIVEVSSYQLETTSSIKFTIACLLNITEDHIEHHGSFLKYTQTKFKIFANQTKKDFALISIDDTPCLKLYKQLLIKNYQNVIPISTQKNIPAGVYVSSNGVLINNLMNKNTKVYDLTQLQYLKGIHNYQNIAFAYTVAKLNNISNHIFIQALQSFKGLMHRQTLVANYKNITFINDSKATNPESSKFALDSFESIYWILGGIPKGDNLDACLPFIHRVKKCFLIGQASNLFYNLLHNKLECFQESSLQSAITNSLNFALKEHSQITILFSPACSSFDMFKNFEDRGDKFTKLVKDLINV